MSNAAEMWIPGEPPRDGRRYLVWLRREYGGVFYKKEITHYPVVLWWDADSGCWEWEDSESSVWGDTLLYAEVNPPLEIGS